METYEVNRLAVGAEAKAVSLALTRLHGRGSRRWISYQCNPPADVQRLDYYGAFWLWFLAIWQGNRAGAEILFEDFRSRVAMLRERDDLSRADWKEMAVRCSDEHAEAIREAFLDNDLPAIKKEVSEAIAAYRKLLAMVEARIGAKSLDTGGQGERSQTPSWGTARPQLRRRVA